MSPVGCAAVPREADVRGVGPAAPNAPARCAAWRCSRTPSRQATH